ncbi:hypothetical protein BD311DRAFT_652515 [Dichomitus squalens]|uniref:HIT-like domain-containing protein n=1 Tax=Dichomitus squalens TaxID=114155 RepID=A0A4Q9N424_9APHY|nr:hypothetical protein BD311DRAFT_652515 [Dichomitus squalens]
MRLDAACATHVDDLSYRESQALHCKLLSILRVILVSSRAKPTTKHVDGVDEQSVLHPHASLQLSCIFCGASKENGFNIFWENDTYTVFADINPSAEHHLQVIPKRHIGMQVLPFPYDVSESSYQRAVFFSADMEIWFSLGFHIPPYISVPHLHMHVQALPYRSCLRRLKYPVAPGRKGYEKGFSWFADAEQTAHLLEKGVQVRIFPC